jgi:hypothetical protein
MLLREGLTRLPEQVGKSERGLGGESAATVISNLDTVTRAPDESDRDPAFQDAVKRAMQQARQFSTRMVGASPIVGRARLDTVAIFASSEPEGCSGVVIAPGAILTAAHCVCDLNLGNQRHRIVFGNDVATSREVSHTIPSGTRIFPSTDTSSIYCADYKKFAVGGHGKVCHRDLALLRFDPATAPADLTIAPFASKAEVDGAFRRASAPVQPPIPWIEVVGFGVAGNVFRNGRLVFRDAGQKRYGLFSFYSDCPSGPQYNCETANGAVCFAQREMIIQDLRNTTDSCGGDSGGPAFLQHGNEWRLAGLVSRALPGGGCGQGGVYSSIYHEDVTKWLGRNGVPGFSP